MKIKDVVNRDIVNLENCDQEPIHIPGSIQPHGFLLALKKRDLTIEYCSQNVSDFTGIGFQDLLQKSFKQIVSEDQFTKWNNYSNKLDGKKSAPLELKIGNTEYQCNVHASNDLWVLEFEPELTQQPLVSQVYDQTLQFVKYAHQSSTLKDLCSNVADEIRNLTGYDRVMVYRFDKLYNGEVYAESKKESLEPFLGLRYPHTDIPVQARELYIKNLLRIIVDVNYTPVPIYTIDDVKEKNIDLSYSVLRSVSPIHVQYLHNMGVYATLTISLMDEGKLWGLIACHHYSKKYIDHYTRVNAQLQGNFLTSQIKVRQMAEEYSIANQVNIALEELLNKSFLPERQSLNEIIATPELLQICHATGVSILLDGVVYKAGITPTDDEIKELSSWVDLLSNNSFYVTSKLSDAYNKGEAISSKASGIVFYALKSLHDASIIWYSPETLEEVYWAGDPEKAIIKNAAGLSPRRSFEKWKEIIKSQSREWSKPELTAAANFAYALQKHVTLVLLTEEDIRQKRMSEELKEINAELENINWISTHDMKEPLRKIQMFSSRLLSKENVSQEIGDTINKMSGSAARMMKLIEDLTIYSKARQTDEHFELLDLNAELTHVLHELHEEMQERNAVINRTTLPRIKGNAVLIRQLFLNLLRNSLKFSKTEATPVIDISWDQHYTSIPPNMVEGNQFHRITFQDNGIGFDQQFGESIFNVFTRLHTKSEYEGSGVGLALCKKIMKLHHGTIAAEGLLGEGSSFHLLFPVIQ